MVITLHGDDNARLNARLNTLLGELLPGDAVGFNLLELDGMEVSIEDIRAACDTLPFLGDRRVVVVKGLLSRFSDKDSEDGGGKPATAAFLKAMKAYLPNVPDSSTLVFLERRKLGASAAANMLRAAGKHEEYSLPAAEDLPAYIRDVVRNAGANIDRDAASLLAEAVKGEPRRLETELQKLLAYRLDEKRISTDDVLSLVEIPLEVAVWTLTDAIYAHDAAASLRALRTLRDRGEPPQKILATVASQLRNVVVAEEYRGAGADRLAAATGMKPFVARKAMGALRNFKPQEPRRLLQALMELDLRVKTGKAEIDSALELMVVEACARRV